MLAALLLAALLLTGMLLATLASFAHAAAPHDHPNPVVLAPGYGALEFEPAPAGSYRLPPLGRAGDGRVLDSDGQAVNLHSLMGDRLVILSFIFTACSDINGCPLATHVLGEVQSRIAESAPELGQQIRLISLSFDPPADSPRVMKAYGARFMKPDFDWRFLTPPNRTALQPILEAYGQWVIRDADAQGRELGSISHVLRVFLIDRTLRIRNIYSISFLHADTLIADLRTLLLEQPQTD